MPRRFERNVLKMIQGAQIMQSYIPNNVGKHPNPWIGRSIGNYQSYRLEACLGEGGMGYVFLATDTLSRTQVALKLFKETLVKSPQSLQLKQQFVNEINICRTLESERIIRVLDYDYGETNEGVPFYVMEYLRGQSLGQLLHQQRQLPVERAVNIINQICDGLSLAHKGVTFQWGYTHNKCSKIVHCDLKPDNIFLVPAEQGDSVKILDFGAAKIYPNQEQIHSIETNTFVGTYHYAAPEQLQGKNVDPRADIYSLGMILYEMISGEDPFGLGLNTNNIAPETWNLAHIKKPVLPLRSQPGLSNLSPLLEEVVLKCLEKSPGDRFPSVDDLKRALQVAVELDLISPPIPSSAENQTIIRPLTPGPQQIVDRTSKLPVDSVDSGVSNTTSPSQKNILINFLKEYWPIIGMAILIAL